MKLQKKKLIYCTLIILGLFGGSLYMILGFHNVDLAWNFQNSGGDCNEFGCVSINTLYLRGIGMMLGGAILNIASGFFSILLILLLAIEKPLHPKRLKK